MNVKNFFLHTLPGIVTTTGAGMVIGNAAIGAITGQMSGQDALYQAGMGIIGIGLRRAIGRLTPAPTSAAAISR